MYCPACADTTLTMSERHGIEIDYCPKCRGVWLDRGELDKIIERSAAPAGRPNPVQPTASRQDHREPPAPAYGHAHRDYPPPPGYGAPPPPRGRDDDDDDDYRDGRRRKRREGFLSDLFDFD